MNFDMPTMDFRRAEISMFVLSNSVCKFMMKLFYELFAKISQKLNSLLKNMHEECKMFLHF